MMSHSVVDQRAPAVREGGRQRRALDTGPEATLDPLCSRPGADDATGERYRSLQAKFGDSMNSFRLVAATG
jgi:hypothetical protein